jgi:hypothetical protein
MASSKLTIKEVTREIPKIIEILEEKIQIIKPHDDSLQLWKEAIQSVGSTFQNGYILMLRTRPKEFKQ